MIYARVSDLSLAMHPYGRCPVGRPGQTFPRKRRQKAGFDLAAFFGYEKNRCLQSGRWRPAFSALRPHKKKENGEEEKEKKEGENLVSRRRLSAAHFRPVTRYVRIRQVPPRKCRSDLPPEKGVRPLGSVGETPSKFCACRVDKFFFSS